LTFDLWLWKSIGFQILLRTEYVPSLVKIHWRMLILECSQGCHMVKIWPCDLDLWPWKSIGFQILLKTKYVPSLVKIHWRMLILECSQGCYGRTDGWMDGRTDGWTDGQTWWNQYTPLQLCCGGYKKKIWPSQKNIIIDQKKLYHSWGSQSDSNLIRSLWVCTAKRGCRGRDCMVVGFTTTYAISAYHHWCCEFESRSGRGAHHYVIKFVSDLRQV
jgi:hypothetical protein